MSLGPDRTEHRVRLAVSLLGLAVLIWIIASGRMTGFAWVEVGAVAGLFFGGSALWSGWILWREGSNK
ncbi:hypothetical protein ROE7235_01002 [Roseibaca ekhonensis]|uniref:Uncharacterized protein n=1 Tax=Roseinatronobacter ekhonensis TaxID=254356 RepID=A0A3B0MTM6_9RHOB|nr:hypothetical protein [Roseibaca ekhonensis]SUZ31266.1 hypothetical protein ROE7235_01002 [Roseibaca ekhonensis]